EPVARRAARSLTDQIWLHDDLANAARLGLVRAIRRHDPATPGFAAYAAHFMTGAARRELSRWLSRSPANCLEDGDAGETEGSAYADLLDRLSPWGDGKVAGAVGALRPDQQRIVHLRYVEDATLADIARESGTSVPAVSQRLATIHRKVAL